MAGGNLLSLVHLAQILPSFNFIVLSTHEGETPFGHVLESVVKLENERNEQTRLPLPRAT